MNFSFILLHVSEFSDCFPFMFSVTVLVVLLLHELAEHAFYSYTDLCYKMYVLELALWIYFSF